MEKSGGSPKDKDVALRVNISHDFSTIIEHVKPTACKVLMDIVATTYTLHAFHRSLIKKRFSSRGWVEQLLTKWNFAIELLIAIAASGSGIAGWAVWQDKIGATA